MEGEAAAAVLQVVVQNLIDHSKKEFSLVQGLNKEAAKLTERLGTLQEFLNDAEKRTIPGGAVKRWLKKLENVAFDADNVLDEFNYHLLSKQNKPITKQKVLSIVGSSRSRNMALRIQEINENLDSINKEAAELGLKETLATNMPTLPDATFETDAFTLDPIFIGRDELVSEIVEIINTSTTTDERVISIFAIVGMGGLGKTTLTRKVFHLLKEKNRFGSHLWVHVSQIFDPIVLLKKILKELDPPHKVEAEMSKQDIMKNLEEVMKDKHYLLILDDVWNQELSKWEDFIDSLLGATSTKGNAIVVTTRSMEVASTVSAIHTHKLEGLSKEDCWSIIKERTFGKEKVPLGFEAIGIEVAEKCQGLPLAARVVSGVLRNKSEEKWYSIKENWLSRDEGDHITKILKLSFDNLSLPSLKKCFAYCSIFPKGHGIKRQKLIEYWMGEGFLVADGNNDMESLGDKFIDVLIRNSLLQIAEGNRYGYAVNYVMHDLVHDLASSVLAGSHNADGITPVRYMFFEKKSSDALTQNAKYLRTLLSMDNIYGNMFSEFKCLHVLTFRSDGVIELPSSVMKLIHLRVLDINQTEIEYLPDWIGKLVHLQTLRAESVYCLKQLPSTLKYLTNLRHLYIHWNVELPAEIGRSTSLQTLNNFKVGDKEGWKIKELGSLNGLKGTLNIHNLERVDGKEEAEKARLSDKSKLLYLHLRWNEYRTGETKNDENVLEGLQPHTNLELLWIQGFKGKRFPSWTQKMEVEKVGQSSCLPLNNLSRISLIDCSECEEIPMLGQLPNLTALRLEGLRNVKSINCSFYGLEKGETRIVFPALKELVLMNMNELIEWAEIDSGASGIKGFPQLQHLDIRNCHKLKGLPNGICTLNLEYLYINGIKVKRFPSWTQKMEVEKVGQRSSCIPLNKLIRISLIDCSECEEIPMLGQLPNLTALRLEGLRNVKSINCSFYGLEKGETRIVFPALKEFTLIDMNELIEWAEIDSAGASGIKVFPQLQHLEIRNCPNLKGLPNGICTLNSEYLDINGIKVKRFPSWIQKMEVEKVGQTSCVPLNNLTKMSLSECFECEEIPVFGQLPNLRDLQLEGFRNVKSVNSFYGLVDGETRIVFPALESLGLKSMDELTEWAEVESASASGIKVFPHLQYLRIENCSKLKRVPKGICTLNLKALFVRDCPNLERVEEDIGVQQSQGNLTWLEIHRCDALQYFPCEMIGSSLERLKLENIRSLKNLPGIIECLPKSPHLRELKIFAVPQLMTSCSDIYAPLFSRLKVLELDASMGGSTETVDALFKACRSSSHSLMTLTLKGIQGCWEDLVKSLQHFTALEFVVLETVGMEKLPQWLHRMNESRQYQVRYGFRMINREEIYIPLPELCTLLNSGNQGSKRAKDLCLSLRCFRRARR